MKDKNTFVMYLSWNDAVCELNDEQAGKLLKSVYEYQSGNKEVKSDDVAVNVLFAIMKERFIPDEQSWHDEVERRKINGRKGGLVKAANARNNLVKAGTTKKAVATVADIEYESVYDSDIENVSVSTSHNNMCDDYIGDVPAASPDGKSKSKKFIPPSLEEVSAYCYERNNNIDAEQFLDFYSAKDWMIGKNRMKDWKATVRNWERNSKLPGSRTTGSQTRQESYIESWLNL